MNVFARFSAICAFPLALLAAGCNSQGEGQRCDIPSDCQAGLDCKQVNQRFVCCPLTGPSSAVACNGALPTIDAGGGADAADGAAGDAEDASIDAGVPSSEADGDGAPAPVPDAAAE